MVSGKGTTIKVLTPYSPLYTGCLGFTANLVCKRKSPLPPKRYKRLFWVLYAKNFIKLTTANNQYKKLYTI